MPNHLTFKTVALPRIDRLVTNALVKRIQEEIDEEEVRRANGLE